MAIVNDVSGQADLQDLLTLYNSRALAEAEQRAKALIVKFPAALVLRNILGASLLDQGKFADAVDCFRGALELETRSPEVHYNLGIALQRSGELEAAAEAYREAVDAKPDYAEAYNNLGVVLADLGQTDDAIASYRNAVAQAPDYAEAYNNLGATLVELGARDQAIDAYRKALEINPDYPEAHNNLGIVLHKKNLWDDAIASFRRALEIAPRYAGAHNNLGNALQDVGRLDEARESYQNALAAQPDLAETLNNLGNVYGQLDHFDNAIECFEKFLATEPDNAEAHNNLGAVYKRNGRLEEAKGCYRRALDLNPVFVDALLNLGTAYFDEERIDDAIECFRAADPKIESTKISALLLDLFYRKNDRTAFDLQLQMIKLKQKTYNFRAGAAAAFYAHQYNTENIYQFCDNPVANVTVFNTLEDGAIDRDFIDELHHAVNESGGNERFEPGPVSAGYHSVGNLFIKGVPQFDKLETVIRRYVEKYHALHKDERSLFIENWATEYTLDGWFVRLFKGGQITAHTHNAWLSGVIYLRVPNKKGGDEGNIEFTLRGYGLPARRDDYPRKMVETFSGALALFPSSLPHRTIPFTADQERLCIAFDVIPN